MKFNREPKRMFAMLLLCTCLAPVGLMGQEPSDGLPQNGFEVPAGESDAGAVEPANEQIVASKRLLDVIKGGGPLMFPIAICSFILVAILERI